MILGAPARTHAVWSQGSTLKAPAWARRPRPARGSIAVQWQAAGESTSEFECGRSECGSGSVDSEVCRRLRLDIQAAVVRSMVPGSRFQGPEVPASTRWRGHGAPGPCCGPKSASVRGQPPVRPPLPPLQGPRGQESPASPVGRPGGGSASRGPAPDGDDSPGSGRGPPVCRGHESVEPAVEPKSQNLGGAA